MRIGIDVYEANRNQRVGIGQYAYHVVSEIVKLDTQNEYILFSPTPPQVDMPHQRQHLNYIIGKPGSLWTIRQLPGLIKQNPVDVFFSPTHYVPWFTNIPLLFSIMDLSYLHFPRMFTTKDYMQLKYMTLYSVKHARTIFTISEFCKQEIRTFYKFKNSDIHVTYPGFTKLPLQTEEKQRTILNKYAICNNFILFTGTLQPRKNVQKLVEAFNKIEGDTQLVLVGKKGWMFEPIMDAIDQSPKRDQIRVLDFINDEELVTLYNNASCFVLPSFYEGFGIPVAEAMYYGCPVVVSKKSSLPEVAGDAGIYIDPENSDDIARGVKQALQLKPEERRSLSKKSQAHVQKFSWEICAKKTLEVLMNYKKI